MTAFQEAEAWLKQQMKDAQALTTRDLQQNFITTRFVMIHNKYKAKELDFTQYTNLINRLAAYKSGQFTDYIDSLTGAAHMGMLDIVVEMNKHVDIAKISEQNSDAITYGLGITPATIIDDDEQKL